MIDKVDQSNSFIVINKFIDESGWWKMVAPLNVPWIS